MRTGFAKTVFLAFFATTCSVQWAHAQTTDKGAPLTVAQGFLFVDGKYVPTPFDVRARGKSLVIGENEYSADYFRLPDDLNEPSSNARSGPHSRFQTQGLGAIDRGQAGPRSRSKRGQKAKRQSEELRGLLRDVGIGFVVVMYEGEEPLLLDPTGEGQDLLEVLTASHSTVSAPPDAAGRRRAEVVVPTRQ